MKTRNREWEAGRWLLSSSFFSRYGRCSFFCSGIIPAFPSRETRIKNVITGAALVPSCSSTLPTLQNGFVPWTPPPPLRSFLFCTRVQMQRHIFARGTRVNLRNEIVAVWTDVVFAPIAWARRGQMCVRMALKNTWNGCYRRLFMLLYHCIIGSRLLDREVEYSNFWVFNFVTPWGKSIYPVVERINSCSDENLLCVISTHRILFFRNFFSRCVIFGGAGINWQDLPEENSQFFTTRLAHK